MPRKTDCPSLPSPGETALVEAPAVSQRRSAPTRPRAQGAAAAAAVATERPPERFWLERVAIHLCRWLGSLQVAIVLLGLFAVVLAIGTLVESWYSGKVAAGIVYHTWWFTLLLCLLGVNIFSAAAKKARTRSDEDVGRDLHGTGYRATLAYWWPWLIVAMIFVFLLLPALSLVAEAVILALFAGLLSLALWGIQQRWPVERWWPWKRHQTGFLITHVGLLTMVAGGVLNSLGGTDAQLALVDCPRADVQEQYGPQVSGRGYDADSAVLRVRLPSGKEESFPFESGPLPWQPESGPARADSLIATLGWLAHPLPHRWERDLADGAHLEVLAYHPQARVENFRAAGSDDEVSYPAVKFRLTSSRAGNLPERWVAHNRNQQSVSAGPALIQMLGSDCSPEQLAEFLQPPPPAEQLGQRGQLVVWLAGQPYRIAVDQFIAGSTGEPRGGAIALGDSGWSLKITRYAPNLLRNGDPTPSDPVLRVELTHATGLVVTYAVMARDGGAKLLLDGKPEAVQQLGELRVWYHVPDWRLGQESAVRAVLQFVTDAAGQLYYRCFNSSQGHFAFEKAGAIEPGPQSYAIWQGMDWQLQVPAYLPHAVAGLCFVPEALPAGVERLDCVAALRCRLTAGRDSQEFWLGRTVGGQTPVALNGQQYQLGYSAQPHDLDFEIKLLRAESTFDRGTRSEASYTSWVQLTDARRGLHRADRMITMNQPLEHAGYKLYQSGYELLSIDENLKPISRSIFTIGRDPGLVLKYLGSIMLALGIACMFYTKAYFFQTRSR